MLWTTNQVSRMSSTTVSPTRGSVTSLALETIVVIVVAVPRGLLLSLPMDPSISSNERRVITINESPD